jgi:DNA-binding beta-propeller fold protein YncE
MPKFPKNFSCSAELVKALLKNVTAIAGASSLGLVAALIVFLAVSAGRVHVAAADVEPTNSLPNPYRTIENWAKLPEGRPWGSTAGVTVDRNGNIWVAERCGANSCAGSSLAPILEFDPSGKLLTSFGAGMFIFPHGITADRDGNIWVTDGDAKDGKGHQVFKFSPKGKVLLALGKPGVAGAGEDTFNKPSAVAVASNGDIFVADGHGGESNARIVKFSKEGTFIMTWGKKGSAPGELNIPHALAFDSKGRLFVADRGNNRIQIFDQNGKFIDQWQQFSRPSGIFIDRNDVIYVADSESGSVAKDHAAWKRGIRIGNAKDGSVASFIPDPNTVPNFTGTSAAEGIAADAKGVIYGAEVGPKDLKKYIRQ